MGTFRVKIEIGDPAGIRFDTLEALVGATATYTWVPRDVLERLGVRPEEEWPFLLADGRQVAYAIAWIRVLIDGWVQPTIAVFGEPGTELHQEAKLLARPATDRPLLLDYLPGEVGAPRAEVLRSYSSGTTRNPSRLAASRSR